MLKTPHGFAVGRFSVSKKVLRACIAGDVFSPKAKTPAEACLRPTGATKARKIVFAGA